MYERIKKLAKDKNISINELEKNLGFSKGSLCKLKKHAPTLDKVEKIANYFNVSVDYIKNGKENIFTEKNAEIGVEVLSNPLILQYAKKMLDLSPEKQKAVMDMIDLLSKEG